MDNKITKIAKEWNREEFIKEYCKTDECPYPSFGLQECETDECCCGDDVFVCEQCWRDAVKDIVFKSDLVQDDRKESTQEKQFYYGDEILKLIREGKILNSEFEVMDIKTGKHRSNLMIKNGVLMYFDGDANVSIDYLLEDRFYPIKEKEYLTFDEARKSNKKFKYKGWKNYYTLSEVFNKLSQIAFINSKEEINEIMDSKGWELEND